jgi:hypothetical protein
MNRQTPPPGSESRAALRLSPPLSAGFFILYPDGVIHSDRQTTVRNHTGKHHFLMRKTVPHTV